MQLQYSSSCPKLLPHSHAHVHTPCTPYALFRVYEYHTDLYKCTPLEARRSCLLPRTMSKRDADGLLSGMETVRCLAPYLALTSEQRA